MKDFFFNVGICFRQVFPFKNFFSLEIILQNFFPEITNTRPTPKPLTKYLFYLPGLIRAYLSRAL